MRKLPLVALAAAAIVLGLLIWSVAGSNATPATATLDPSSGGATFPARAALEPPSALPEFAAASNSSESASEMDDRHAVAAPAEALALLRVHVLSKEDKTPVVSKRVSLVNFGTDERFDCRPVSGQHASIGECPTTGDDGWAELEAEPGKEYALRLMWLERSMADHDVPALMPGERREVEILVSTASENVLYGILLDAEDGSALLDGLLQVPGKPGPMAYAPVRAPTLESASRAEIEQVAVARTGADGRFQISGRKSEFLFVSASAPGHSRAVFALTAGHSDPKNPLEIRLWRSASVAATVVDGAGSPVKDASVELTTDVSQIQQGARLMEPYKAGDPRWFAVTDDSGRANILGLPPRVPLKLSIKRPGSSARTQAEPLVLAVGERREIGIPWLGGGIVQGRAIDGNGQPLANQELWRVAGERNHDLPAMLTIQQEPAATTRTDQLGRFRFGDVGIGSWLVGIAPGWERYPESFDSGRSMSSYALPVEVKTAGQVVELELRVDAKLSVRGKVIDPAGEPLRFCTVSAALENTNIHVQVLSGVDGEFELGGLINGLWTLEAGVADGQLAPSPAVRVQAGSTDIVLQLRAGSSIVGRVVDAATLELAECEVCLAPEDAGSARWATSQSRNGEFRFSGVLPGTYRVCARDRAGSIGISAPIPVEANQTVREIEVRLARGAAFRLRYEGASKFASYVVVAAGSPIRSSSVERGQLKEEVVPTGAIEVRWTDNDSTVRRTQVLAISRGEMQEVVWDGKP